MDYEIDMENSKINIRGCREEISEWVVRLVLDCDQSKEKKKNLKDYVEDSMNNPGRAQWNFGTNQRIYFDRDSILYLPNLSAGEGRKFYFEKVILPSFEKVRKTKRHEQRKEIWKEYPHAEIPYKKGFITKVRELFKID